MDKWGKAIITAAVTVLLVSLSSPVQAGEIRFFGDCIYAKDVCPNDEITFWLYTNETQNDPLQLKTLKLRTEDFARNGDAKSLVILIHGYTGHRDFSPNTEIRPVLLQYRDVFVISVDYGDLVMEPCYVQAVGNVPVVAKCLAQLINGLIDAGIFTSDQIHIIGFSLGSQVAGVTANYVKQKLKWITGLDPAKPLFVTVSEMNKLDPSDAEFVDVIHTDVFERGMLRATGRVDFYPNLGQYQPGCRYPNITSPGSCNHKRAPDYYAESISTSIGFWGFACAGWLQYFLGLCYNVSGVDHQLMGYFVSKNASGSYFLETNSDPPYARGPYKAVAVRKASVAANVKVENYVGIKDYIAHGDELPPFLLKILN